MTRVREESSIWINRAHPRPIDSHTAVNTALNNGLACIDRYFNPSSMLDITDLDTLHTLRYMN